MKQALIDRLIISVDEQDVLYCLVWLRELREKKWLESAINSKHSRKDYSALAQLVQNEFNQLRKIMMELLLLSGADSQNSEVMDLAVKARSMEATIMLLNWERVGKEEANDAQRLLEMTLEDAADWIDENLPQPPNPDSLTGEGPLSSRLSTTTVPSLSPTLITTEAPPSPPPAAQVKIVESKSSIHSRDSTSLHSIATTTPPRPRICISALSYLSPYSDESELSPTSPILSPASPASLRSPSPRRRSSSSPSPNVESYTPASSRAPSPEVDEKPTALQLFSSEESQAKEETITIPTIGIKGCATETERTSQEPVERSYRSRTPLSLQHELAQSETAVTLKVSSFPYTFTELDLEAMLKVEHVVSKVVAMFSVQHGQSYAFIKVAPVDARHGIDAFIRQGFYSIFAKRDPNPNLRSRFSDDSRRVPIPSRPLPSRHHNPRRHPSPVLSSRPLVPCTPFDLYHPRQRRRSFAEEEEDRPIRGRGRSRTRSPSPPPRTYRRRSPSFDSVYSRCPSPSPRPRHITSHKRRRPLSHSRSRSGSRSNKRRESSRERGREKGKSSKSEKSSKRRRGHSVAKRLIEGDGR